MTKRRGIGIAVAAVVASSLAFAPPADPPDARRDVFGVALHGQRMLDLTANDALAGEITDLTVEGDTRGEVRVDVHFRLHYTAPEAWCGEERLTYEVCTAGGCDTSSVLVQVICEDVYVFNGVSPNGDGVNDNFTVLGLGNYAAHRVLVFDQQGQRVFSSTDYANDWPLTTSAAPPAPGTYYYVVELESRDALSGYLQIE